MYQEDVGVEFFLFSHSLVRPCPELCINVRHQINLNSLIVLSVIVALLIMVKMVSQTEGYFGKGLWVCDKNSRDVNEFWGTGQFLTGVKLIIFVGKTTTLYERV